MTFFSISKKMLTAHIKNYRIFFIGNLYTVILFFVFATIFTNTTFFDPTKVNSIISSNIYFASAMAGFFLVVFLPISSQAFWSARRRDYGVLSVLGMGSREVLIRIALEYVGISLLTLLISLIAGTILSGAFHVAITCGIGISGIDWIQSAKPFTLTIFLYVCEMLIVLGVNVFLFLKTQLIQLIKREKMVGKKALWMRGFEHFLPKWWYRNLVKWIPFVGHRGIWVARYLVSIILVAASFWLAGVCISFYPSVKQTANSYAPYDMVYCQAFDKNNVPQQTIQNIFTENGVKLQKYEQASYLRDQSFNILSESQANAISQKTYQVNRGEYLMLYQIDPEDGYSHNRENPDEVLLGGCMTVRFFKSVDEILWNPNPMFADQTVIVNDSDYQTLEKQKKNFFQGTMYLYQFKDWRNSHDAVSAVNAYLQKSNGLSQSMQHRYRATSRIEQYEDAKKSEQFLVLVMSFLIVLLNVAAVVVINLGLQSEENELKKAVRSLNGLGVSKVDLQHMAHFESTVRYFNPIIGGIVLGGCFVFWWNRMVYATCSFVIMGDILIAILMLAMGYFLVHKSCRKMLRVCKFRS